MRVENNNKAFAFRIYSHFKQQCPWFSNEQSRLSLENTATIWQAAVFLPRTLEEPEPAEKVTAFV
jgi:hypothetical protein